MPLYNTATAAVALKVPPKWLDNLLSHNHIDGLQNETQGVARRLSVEAVAFLMVARELIDQMELSVPAALRTARRLIDAPEGNLALSPRLHMTLDASALRADVLARLRRAVETAPAPRRGRPPKR
jgi:hypothetical protein